MTPESNEKINFKVYYLDPSIKNSQTYWEKSAEAWRKDYEEYMAAEKALKKEVRTLVGSEIGAEARLRKIYERVQSIKNLNYAREMSENDWKKIKPNKNVADVLKRNYGFRDRLPELLPAWPGRPVMRPIWSEWSAGTINFSIPACLCFTDNLIQRLS